MEQCIVDKIVEARMISVELGKKKYKEYFINGMAAILYKEYKKKVDDILKTKRCDDCIVTV